MGRHAIVDSVAEAETARKHGVMTSLQELRSTFRLRPVDGMVNLAGYATDSTPFVESESAAKHELAVELHDRLFDHHELLFAEEERSVLLVLQGLDCSGKNGTIKHVVIAMNPAGVRTASFTEPTEKEREHHFLWRHREALPGPGNLVVFNRSHYEDVLVPIAEGTLQREDIDARLDDINAFEAELVDAGTTIIKCMLHLSFDEQRSRFLRRLRRDDKRWKFAESDMESRRLWNEYQAAYGDVLASTSPDCAPWHVIPADNKWYRNWAVAQLLDLTLQEMAPAYPQPDFDIDALRDQLQPPH